MPPIELPQVEDDGRFRGQKVAIVASGSATAGNGGAERFYAGLKAGFEAIGCTAEFVEVEASEPSVEQILKNYVLASGRDLSRYDIVVTSKVPTYAVRHPNQVLFLNHAVRIFDDMFEERFPNADAEAFGYRARVHRADFEALLSVRARFSQGFEIARRLMRWRGLSSFVLHPPLGFDAFEPGEGDGAYFLSAGRLHPWKRVHLLIEAVRCSRRDIRLVIAGDGEQNAELRQMAGGDPRIEFLGRVSDEHLVDLYRNAVAVPFVSKREDFGYITLEAFASGRPVLTCIDSGEPAHIVRHLETGLVVAPTPLAVAEGLEWLWDNRATAKEMGRKGREYVSAMSWRSTAFALASAAKGEAAQQRRNRRVCVLDMQPIEPAVGGGRLRLLGLYHNLGEDVSCSYIGTYDWPGEKYRRHALSPTLIETDIPLSAEHFVAANELARRAGGKNVIDLAFSRQALLSPDYVQAARSAVAEADVVVFSHPWIYPLVKDKLRPSQVVIYEAHNVEGFLRAQLLSEENPVEQDVLENVVQDELECGKRADWILACSHEDLLRFNRLYGFSPGKMRVAPNGVMAFSKQVPDASERAQARAECGLAPHAFAGIFIGSGYGPNLDAAVFINEQLAAACPDVTFIIAGGVGETLVAARSNVIVTGRIDDDLRDCWYRAADFAVNPMMAGSGTNIKMFDFMAMGLPIVTTEIGARGIETGGADFMRVVPGNVSAFAEAIGQLRDAGRRAEMGGAARACVEEGYAWERISAQLGQFLAMREALAGQTQPRFSVVIPSYERPDQLRALLMRLQDQIERDFEVVVVDQSETPWPGADAPWGFPLFYYHSPVKGAVRARNTGAMLAQGQIVAFIDDDCLPEPDWLQNSRKYFIDPDVVGLEGLIRSDHLDDPDWRPVTNVGFEGIGFMTANLMVRSAAFQFIGGFDLQFDKPHFREDTDLGWRLQDLGKVPYGRDVVVFHPAQPRSIERESLATRTRFFIKDALLWRKHPARYRSLFEREGHFISTAGFKEALLSGFKQIGLSPAELPDWLREKIGA